MVFKHTTLASVGIGVAVPRLEDERFLRGEGCFGDDLSPPNVLYAAVVRSTEAHALIRTIGVAKARAAPGVRGVYLAADLRDAGIQPIPSMTRTPPFQLFNSDGTEMAKGDQYPLAEDKVRYVGEPLAFVVAETDTAARTAAELVEVELEPLAPQVNVTPQVNPVAKSGVISGPQAPIWQEHPDNESFHWQGGDPEAVANAFAVAARVVRLDLSNQRIVSAFMEPRGVLGSFDSETSCYTVHAGMQSAHTLQQSLALIFAVPPESIHCLACDMGGGFGARNVIYPEHVMVLFAARRLGCAVKWCAERSESFLADAQARDQVYTGELALDEEGRFLAIRVNDTWRHGAYFPGRILYVYVTHFWPMLCGAYSIPSYCVDMRGVFSNTAPIAAYRGVARAEAAYLLESLVDEAARQACLDPVEIRRRNLIPSDAMPWSTATGCNYENGEFAANLDRALELADHATVSERRTAAEVRGMLHGIGISLYVESDGGAPSEFAEVRIERDGRVCAYVGTQNFGMGHETVFPQVLHEVFGLTLDRFAIVQGDTRRIPRGFGSHGSRSMRIGGSAVLLAAREVLELAREAAAELLQSAPADVNYAKGSFFVGASARSIGLDELASEAAIGERVFAASVDFETQGPVYHNGCQVCEVEVDPQTGLVKIVRHVLIADVGRAVNPLIVHGQLHGALAQGLGQAGLEQVFYDQTGQLLTGSFMDYTLPRADDFPVFVVELNEVWSNDNPLGVKGAGEGPTTGAPPAFINAVRHAIGPRAGARLRMPATPECVWRAMKD